MKRLLILLALALGAGGFLAWWLMRDPGYVLIVRDNWEIETSAGFLLLMLLGLVVAVVILTLLLAGLWNLLAPHRVRRRMGGYVSRRRLQLGATALVQERHERAERLLSAAAEQGEWPLAGWLGAARAAAARGRIEQARQYLEKAHDCKDGQLPAGLEMARIALTQGDLGSARQELEALSDRWHDHQEITRMRLAILEREQDWDALRNLLPRARHDSDTALRERRLWLALLQRAAERPGFDNREQRREELHALWKDMPTVLQRDPALRARQAGYLAQLGDGKQALKLVTSGLEQGWDDRLPAVLDAIEDLPAETLLQKLESWLETRPGNATLLLTAGRVALRARLWGKARSFFEAASRGGHNATARAELCRLLRALGDHEGARRCLEEQLHLSGQELPQLPLPEKGEQA